ncbi:MAG: GGDEF domain-containing protein [Spirochaetaceae bacterium]|nr:GGDEF domain-containing protein [Spirochaetaceae bacterium]
MDRLFAAEREFGERLGAEGRQGILRDIDRANWLRLRIFYGLTMLFELLLVAMVDLPALVAGRSGTSMAGRGEPPSLPLAYMACHMGIFLACGLGLFSAFRGLGAKASPLASKQRLSAAPTLMPSLIAMVILTILGVIAALDQLRSGDISAFTINIVVAALLIYIRPPLGFLVFTPGFLLMFAGVALLQRDADLRLAHLVNGGIFYSAVLLLSAYLYNNHYSQLAKSILIEDAAAKIQDLSLHDELTGLSNRRAFIAIVERELARMKREGRRAYLAVADIDHFKTLNDRCGHPAGDAMLRLVAETLADSTRAVDAVARWGGEEFIFFIAVGDAEMAREVLERARRTQDEARLRHEGQTLSCTLSFGFAELKAEEGEDAFSKAYRRADAALYAAKEAGRNRVVGASAE